MKIELGCFGIVIEDNCIKSDLIDTDDTSLVIGAMHAVESMVLAHHCAGIDVTTPAYLEGIETAVESIYYNLGE